MVHRAKKLKRAALLFLAALFCLQAGCGRKQAGEGDFSAYLDQVFRTEAASNTLTLHYSLAHPENYGITEYPVTYGSLSADSGTWAAAILENWKGKLQSFDQEKMTVSQKMAYDVMMDYIETQLPAAKYALYDEILRPSTGFQAQLPALLAEYAFYDERDVEDYLGLLSCTREYFSQIAEIERKKSEKGLFMADFAAEDIVRQCEEFIEEPEDNYLLATFDERVDEADFLTPKQAEAYKEKNRKAVLESVIPAYEELAEAVAGLKGTGKNSGGLCGLPDGKKYYECLVKDVTGSDRTVGEMQARIREQRERDLEDLADLLAKDADIQKKSAHYQIPSEDPEWILADLQEKMQKDFPTPPQTPYTVKQVHPSMEEYTAPAFYLTPPIDDVSKNSIYINQSKGTKKMQLYTTLGHEGFPGHLYQNVMERSCGLEPIRSLFGSGGYVEGWATYAEMRSFFYADIDKNLAAFLQKNQSALLSLYATADIGIHYEGWTLRDTIDFFASYQISDKSAIREVFQLIVEEPAHYLKYYIGYLEFLDLQDYAKDRYGESYSDRQFHDVLMRMGNAPFAILKKYLPKFWES